MYFVVGGFIIVMMGIDVSPCNMRIYGFPQGKA
jgi:hypothetical protein